MELLKQKTNKGRLEGDGPLITLRKVGKSYVTPAGCYPALRDIDLEIGAGEFVALVGKSGSGKSTLLNLIGGIDRPSQGEVIVAGARVHQVPERALARWRGKTVGVVFQFFQLLPTLTIIDLGTTVVIATHERDISGIDRTVELVDGAIASKFSVATSPLTEEIGRCPHTGKK